MMKWIALAGAVLVAIGGIGMASVHASGLNLNLQQPWHLNLNVQNGTALKTYNVNKTEAVSAKSVTALQVDADTAVIRIKPGAGNDVSAHLYGRAASNKPMSNLALSVTKAGSKVRIVLKRKSSMDMTIGFNQHINLDVTVPQKNYNSLVVQSNTGEVNASDLSVQQMDFHVDTGALMLQHMHGNIDGTTNTGAINITDIDGSLNLSADTGKIEVNESTLNHSITAKTNTGEVTVHADTPPKNLHFDLSTSIGSATAHIPHATVSGSHSNLSGTVGSGSPVITEESDVGAVTLTAG